MDTEYMLTTVDNPFNPYTHFDEWNAYDQKLGHYSLSFLARVVVTSNELPEEEQKRDILKAIDEIVMYNVSGVHTKVSAPEADPSGG